MPPLLLSAPVTFFIVSLVLIFSLVSFFNKFFFYKMALHPYELVRRRQFYRLFTADFVHIDAQHFILNEASLFFVCGDLERHLKSVSPWGSLQFASIYLASMLTGNILMIIFHRNEIEFSTAGASGSIMGCLFGFMYLEPHKTAFFLPVIGPVANEYYAIIYILLMVLLKKRIEKSGANYELHFWGAIGGIAMTLIILGFF